MNVHTQQWQGLGNSKSRSSEQSEKAKQLAEQYLAKTGRDIVIFTDGSATGNPGPCGAGASIYWNGLSSSSVHYTRPVSKLSSSYHGEIQAIDLALETVVSRTPIITNKKVHILTDCQSALYSVTSNSAPSNFSPVVRSITTFVTVLHQRNVSVHITWIAGHVDLHGNEEADSLAKAAAMEAEGMITSQPISMSEAKGAVKKSSCKKWQLRWDRTQEGSWTHNLYPIVRIGGVKSYCDRPTEVKINRLILGHTCLKDNLNKIMSHICPSPNCDCEEGRETTEHYLLYCKTHDTHREALVNKIDDIYHNAHTPYEEQTFNCASLLGDYRRHSVVVRGAIKVALAAFVRATQHKI